MREGLIGRVLAPDLQGRIVIVDLPEHLLAVDFYGSEVMLSDGAVEDLKRSWDEDQLVVETKTKRTSLSARIEEREAKKSRLADLLLDEVVDHATYQEKSNGLDFELDQLRRELSELPDPKALRCQHLTFLELLRDVAAVYARGNRTERRQLLRQTFSARTADQSSVQLVLKDWAVTHLRRTGTTTAKSLELS